MISFSNPNRFVCITHSCRSASQPAVILFLFGQLLLFGSFSAQAALRENGFRLTTTGVFTKGDPTNCTVSLLYDVREQKTIRRLAEAEADGNTSPNSATSTSSTTNTRVSVIKQWILPTGKQLHQRPVAGDLYAFRKGNLGDDVAYQCCGRISTTARGSKSTCHDDWAITGPFIALRRRRHGTIADRRHWLVSEEVGNSDDRFRQIHFPGSGRGDVLLDGVVEWSIGRRLALRLRVVARGLDAVCEAGRRERTRHPIGQSAKLVTLVSRRWNLSQCVAG